jgi:hypothetical protein
VKKGRQTICVHGAQSTLLPVPTLEHGRRRGLHAGAEARLVDDRRDLVMRQKI